MQQGGSEYTGILHGLDLIHGAALAAGDNRAGVTHAASGGRREAGDEADHGLAVGAWSDRV
jgi:hypothetical protein